MTPVELALLEPLGGVVAGGVVAGGVVAGGVVAGGVVAGGVVAGGVVVGASAADDFAGLVCDEVADAESAEERDAPSAEGEGVAAFALSE